MWGWPTVSGPLSELGFWKFSSSESTKIVVNNITWHKLGMTYSRREGRLWFALRCPGDEPVPSQAEEPHSSSVRELPARRSPVPVVWRER